MPAFVPAFDAGTTSLRNAGDGLLVHTPGTPEQLAEALDRCAKHDRTIVIEGAGSKRAMAGPVEFADETISVAGLRRVVQYEPADLTVSVEAGLPWAEFTELLAANRQMVPLDPPFAQTATVGGVIASNSSGSRRRLYGTARDMVVGMLFATLEGKLVQSGGMVVKNVAGLDMAKLMIGSFGTLAAIAVVNFKLTPMPEVERSFLLAFDDSAPAIAARNRILAGALQPAAVDVLNAPAGNTLGRNGWLLAVRAGGNQAAVDRYESELTGVGDGVALEGAKQQTLWGHVGEFTPWWLRQHPDGAIARLSCTLNEVESAMRSFPGPAIARAGTGVCYGYFETAGEAAGWLAGPGKRAGAVLEFSPDPWKRTADLWPLPGGDLELMRRVKGLFDPSNLLNRGRLYRRI
jgi:glycolate oxidase FAD binding subunit